MSPKSMARLAGLLYLVVAVAGGFAQLGARSGLVVAGDPAATAERIRASETVLRIGFVADVVNVVAFLAVALLLYRLLAPASRGMAGAFLAFNAIAVAIMAIDLVNHVGAIVVATDPAYTIALGAGGADALAALFLDLHRWGYLVAEVFFGLWLLPLGIAVRRSGAFPQMLGTGLVLGSVSYLGSFALSMAATDPTSSLSTFVAMPAAIAELALMAWLLIRGIGSRADVAPRPAPEGAPA